MLIFPQLRCDSSSNIISFCRKRDKLGTIQSDKQSPGETKLKPLCVRRVTPRLLTGAASDTLHPTTVEALLPWLDATVLPVLPDAAIHTFSIISILSLITTKSWN